jgi:hypothetical protein
MQGVVAIACEQSFQCSYKNIVPSKVKQVEWGF